MSMPAVLRPAPASASFTLGRAPSGLALAPPHETIQQQQQQQQPAITLLLERRNEASSDRFTSLAVAPDETIKSVKLRIAQRSAFTTRHCLVLGDRELVDDQQTVGELAVESPTHAPSGQYLHIVCRLKDIESVVINTSTHRTLSFALDGASPPIRRSKSALTALLASPYRSDGDSPSAASTQLATRSPSLPLDGVVHLVIRKSVGVHWRHQAGAKLELSISADATAEEVAAEVEAANDLPAKQHALVYNGQLLEADQSLASYGIADSAVLELVPLHAAAASCGSPPLSSPEHGLFADWQAAQAGLSCGMRPQLASSGSGGSYFIPNAAGDKVAVLKPADEEPFSANNPRHMGSSPDGHGLRKGIRPGEGAVREVAAYVLDHGHFAGVPPTAMVACQPHMLPGGASGSAAHHGTKVGSLQQYVHADTDCEEMGVSAFPVREVHKIAQLDMRLANADRNGGNILAKRDADSGAWTLIPIDHGYTLPDSFQDLSFDWLNWPQAHMPFDAETSAYIASLDADADLAALAAHGLHLRTECKRVFKAATMCLQLGAARNLTPYAIGSAMCRELRTKSPLEKLSQRAAQLARARVSFGGGAAFGAAGGMALSGMASTGCGASGAASGGFSQEAVYFEELEALLVQFMDELADEQALNGLAVA